MDQPAGPSVVYLIDSLAAGGAERSLVDMAPGLVDRGVRLTVAVLLDRGGLEPELLEAGVEVHHIGGHNRVQSLRHVTSYLRIRRPDLLHTTLFESDVIGRSAAFITGTPVVSTLASTPYGEEHSGEPGIKGHRLRAAQLADVVTARVARRFHAVSQATAAACIARMRLDPRKVEVIPRGRDLRRLGAPGPERRDAVRAALGIDPAAPVILFVGRQEPAKGLDVLLGAMPTVLASRSDGILLVAGREGRATAAARRIVESGRLESAVRLLGERSDVPNLLAAADVFVLPSHREGLPGAVLEAMAMEVPIVASDIPTVREAVPDEEHAFLVPAGDPRSLARAVERALSDRSEAARRVKSARSRFDSRFDMASVARSMVSFYARTLSA